MAAGLALGVATSCIAENQSGQPNEDWALTRLADQGTIGASVSFDSGISIIARCRNDVFDLIVGGLPEAPRGRLSRSLIVLGEGNTDERPFAWTVGRDRTVAFSRVPARFARILAKGGPLQIIVPGAAGQARTRYVLTLPPSGAAIEETLSQCGRPLVDPRDDRLEGEGDGMPNGIVWARPPRLEFPESVGGRSPTEGYVTISCVVGPGGRLAECQIESEHPAGFNLGRSALRALPNARLDQTPEARAAGRPFEGVLVLFSTNFILR